VAHTRRGYFGSLVLVYRKQLLARAKPGGKDLDERGVSGCAPRCRLEPQSRFMPANQRRCRDVQFDPRVVLRPEPKSLQQPEGTDACGCVLVAQNDI
jgi:hypothetical protein